MKRISSKMNWVHNLLFRKRCSKVGFNNCKEWGFKTAGLLAACLLYLSGAVAADHYDWKSSVPNRRHASPVFNRGTISPSRQTTLQLRQQNNKSYHNDNPSNHPRHRVSTIEKAAESVLSRSPSSWYTSQSNDPRMGFSFTDSPSAAASSTLLKASPLQQPLVAMPRSLSGLFSPTPQPSPSSTTNSTSHTGSANPAKMKSKSKRKNKQKKTSKANDTMASSKSSSEVAVVSSSITTQNNTELTPSTSRTFLLTPLLAWLVPVFIAQMFGMGMIPAAALITIPIFLLPVGLAAAVFLV